jgi:hypothetical protein
MFAIYRARREDIIAKTSGTSACDAATSIVTSALRLELPRDLAWKPGRNERDDCVPSPSVATLADTPTTHPTDSLQRIVHPRKTGGRPAKGSNSRSHIDADGGDGEEDAP